MSCVGDQCGTGGGNIPKPGDPSNNGILSAKPAFGGIDINWTFPTTNPFAVAYTTIYRARSADFNTAILLAPQVGGGFYYDPVDPGVEYFYWITFVSINGTVGELIGPVSAVARSSIDKTIEELTGKIDAGVLAQSLKTEIGRIGTVDNNLVKEIQDRALAEAVLNGSIDQVQDVADLSIAAVVEETTKRETADAAMVDAINLVYAQAAGNAAAVQQEAIVRASKDEVLAQQITTTETTMGDNLAQVETNLQTQITATDGTVTAIGALYTAKVNVNGLIGGFGIYNDGTTVEAGFDVDTFWIGRTGENKKKPFIIVGGEVFIDQAVINELSVSKLTSGEVGAEWRMTGANGRIVVNNGAVMKVIGMGFGANADLIEWFGPSMAITSCTKANALAYLSTDGSAYFGGTLSAGVLKTAVTNPSFDPNAQVVDGPFGSNGGAINVVCSLNWGYYRSSRADTYTAGSGTNNVVINLYRTIGLGAESLVQTASFSGSTTIENTLDPDTQSTCLQGIAGSFTYVDSSMSTENRVFRAVITITEQVINITPRPGGSGSADPDSFSQRLTLITTE